MRKNILFLICLLLSFSSFTNPDISLKDKAAKIFMRLASHSNLPERIIPLWTEKMPLGQQNTWQYSTFRKGNNVIDSVVLTIAVNTNDTLQHLDFNEEHYNNGFAGTSYAYSINKNGILDFAHRESPGKTMLIEINVNFPDSINLPDSVFKKADESVVEMYKARLKLSVVEFYRIIFIEKHKN